MNIYENALRKIKEDEKCKPQCCSIIGPTGPTGPTGATERLFKSLNNIIIDSSKDYYLKFFGFFSYIVY